MMSSATLRSDKAERVVVAMSGGVDSNAAALMLHQQGYAVIGVSMQVWDYRRHGGQASRATCCAPSDFDDAREVADLCGFPFYVFDFEESFEEAVISPFVQAYLDGYTPNPCLECNRKVKFKALRQRAKALGAQKVATGHYAQIREHRDGSLGLFTAKDKDKDQSYFLYAMTQDELKATIWPVGGMCKSDVRDYLSAQGVRTASKMESQDICFVSGSVSGFIKKHRGGKEEEAGEIVKKDGSRLGFHDGISRFTVGQRRGLGISDRHPLYVLGIDAQDRRITVGSRDELERESFLVKELNWVSGKEPEKAFDGVVKVRYRHPGVPCLIEPLRIESKAENGGDKSVCKVSFKDSWTAVSPGQAAVVYREEEGELVEVLGGGIIEKEEA